MINAFSTVAQTPATTQAAATSAPSGMTSDFNTFLKMLTAQARYQDPMEPLDSSQFASQLAQFSMVEQQVKTNQSLALMTGQVGNINNIASLANWVGMEARAVTPAYFDGSPITVSSNPVMRADRAELVVHDAAGNEVQRSPMPVSGAPIEWAGVGTNGAPFAEGTYSFTVDSYKGDELLGSEPAEVYGKVIEAQIQNGQIILILEGGQAILSSTVTGLRAAT